jgi:Ca2+:H+ antiporter
LSKQQAAKQPGGATISTPEAGAVRAALPGDPTGSLPHSNSQVISSNDGAAASNNEKTGEKGAKPSMGVRFYRVVKNVLLSSWFNVLLVFVPVGIAAHFANLSPGIIFAMNAIAIIPLAGLLAHATESVASKLGDTIGALMNVTFGNAVELIIFIIALVKDEIRIVQAALLGSILANLLLILGMCFLFGGLRFREQIYNSTVTQMSACLLSLAVTSLLLPVSSAFRAETNLANHAIDCVSRLL